MGQEAEGPKDESYLIPPVFVLPMVQIASVEANGTIRLASIPDRPQFWQATEGHYLIMTPPAQPGLLPAGVRPRPLDGLVRIEVVEVVEGNKLTAKTGPDAAKILKVGDTVALVRPTGMTTALIRNLPAVIPILKEGDPKAMGKQSESLVRARQAARLAQSVNNLKQIGLAMHNFHSTNDNFPPAIVRGPDGKPWHSWRVLILPYLEQTAIFNQYDFTQPWDSPKNSALIDKMPSVYRDLLDDDTTGSNTHYAALVGERTIFSPKGSSITIENGHASSSLYKGLGLRDNTDGTSNTIAIVPVDPSKKIPWTKPEDINVGDDFPGLGKAGGIFTPARIDGVGLAPILFLDGSVQVYSEKSDPTTIRNMTTIRGGEIIDRSKLISSTGVRPQNFSRQAALHLFRDGKNVSAIVE